MIATMIATIGNQESSLSAPCQRRRLLCKAIGMVLFARSLAGSRAAVGQSGHPFTIFDGLLYKDKPDLRAHGLVPIDGSGELWRPGVSTDNVDEIRIRSIFEPFRNSSGFYYIDIENWPLQSVPADTRRQNIEKLTRVIDLARRTAPNLHIGLYGLLPGIAYWPLIRHDGDYYKWLEVNSQLELLAKHVDAVFPSLYTFYADLEGWKNYARQTLTEARRYGKPVYAFLWPEFHDSNPELGGHQLPTAFWRAELELCTELADGIVLWGGWKQQWNEMAPWWQETLVFIKAHADAASE